MKSQNNATGNVAQRRKVKSCASPIVTAPVTAACMPSRLYCRGVRHVLMLTIALVCASCGGVQSSPVAPDVTRPEIVTPEPVRPAWPHFLLEIAPPTGPVYEGELWVASASITPYPGIVRPDLPAALQTRCGELVRDYPGFRTGTMRIACELPVGSHPVSARALMGDGLVYEIATTAVVSYRPTQRLPLHYSVVETGRGFTIVAFGFATFEGAEYRWTFGDGDSATTKLNGIEHRYTGDSKERTASVTVTKEGRTLATGSVVGIW